MDTQTLYNACHEMLGIHPSEQPADFYRLLALYRFESNPVVISNAAECRMSFVRQLAAGPCGHAAEELLSMLAEAQLCLLNEARKSAYDATLERQATAAGPGARDADKSSWVVGSAPGCDIVVTGEFVSKRHCALTRRDDSYLLEDLGSRNGTYVNGVRLDGATEISLADVVTLGRKTRLAWQSFVDPGNEAPAAEVNGGRSTGGTPS
jgi:hypothetical protein